MSEDNKEIELRRRLIEKLEDTDKKFREFSGFPRLARLMRRPLYTIRNAATWRIIPVLEALRCRIPLVQARAHTFFGETMYVGIPEYGHLVDYGVLLGYAEVRLTKFCINRIKRDYTFFDVGANYGYYSLLAASLARGGNAYAFEPNPETLKILSKNKRSNMHIINSAVSDRDGNVDFYMYDQIHSVISSMHAPRPSSEHLRYAHVSRGKVASITLDSFCKNNNVTPDIIKIDVEGAEFVVLRGAENLLRRASPVISMEVQFQPLTENYLGAIDFLRKLGFRMFGIQNNGEIKEVKGSFPEDYFRFLSAENILEMEEKPYLDNIVFQK